MVSRFNQNAEAKRKVDLVRTNPSGSKTELIEIEVIEDESTVE